MKDVDETTPDELMEDFRGRSLKTIIVFTIAIHAVVLLGTSVPFLVKSVMGMALRQCASARTPSIRPSGFEPIR